MTVNFYGIRHHGYGSARNLVQALEEQQPDCLLLEAPPEGQELLELIGAADCKPPIALLAYVPEDSAKAIFYPFSEFAPEWQAMRYALAAAIPCQFFDLPVAQLLALDGEERPAEGEAEDEKEESDPFDRLAELSGHRDGEHWWDRLVENCADEREIFAAVAEAVTALRAQYPEQQRRHLLREAHMRLQLQAAEKKFKNIAVICGAWHLPALSGDFSAKDDRALLKGLNKLKVNCTLIPWTNQRLSRASGYGAGINAPRWYEHRWRYPEDDGTRWLALAANLLRQAGWDVSASHILEALRLSRALAALEEQRRPDLDHYLSALSTVVSMGDDKALEAIGEKWLVGSRLGTVPEATPQLPLVRDLAQQRQRLRLPLTAGDRTLSLDLRKELDLQRSIFIHRLRLLDINWAEPGRATGKGTFKEIWETHYEPEQEIRLLERAIYGNDLASAATAYGREQLEKATKLAELGHWLERVNPADLPQLQTAIAAALATMSASQGDVPDLLGALKPLATLLRYGDVRGQANGALEPLLLTLLTRLAVGGAQGCRAIDEDRAREIFTALAAADGPLLVLENAPALEQWQLFLGSLADAPAVNPLLKGLAWRLLLDRGQRSLEAVEEALYQSLSMAGPALDGALWLEGFLQQSGAVLVIHQRLLPLIHQWLAQLEEERFTELLPLLRRSFASFSGPERQKIGTRLQQEDLTAPAAAAPVSLNEELALQAAHSVLELLGY